MKPIQKIPAYLINLIYSASAGIKYLSGTSQPGLKAKYPAINSIYPVLSATKHLYCGIYTVLIATKQLFYANYPGHSVSKQVFEPVRGVLNGIYPGINAIQLHENSFHLLNRIFLQQCFWYCSYTILNCLHKFFVQLFINTLQQPLHRCKKGYPHLPVVFMHCRPP